MRVLGFARERRAKGKPEVEENTFIEKAVLAPVLLEL